MLDDATIEELRGLIPLLEQKDALKVIIFERPGFLHCALRYIALCTILRRDRSNWFPDPDCFDVRRDNAWRHMAFGAGPHMCLVMNLAKLEMRALFAALARKVTRFRIEAEERMLHNTLRGFSKLIVTVE